MNRGEQNNKVQILTQSHQSGIRRALKWLPAWLYLSWSSLRFKLTLGYALVFMFSIVLGAGLIYLIASIELTRSLDATLAETAAVAGTTLKQRGGEAQLASSWQGRSDLSLELLDARGDLIAQTGPQHHRHPAALQLGFQTLGEWRVYTTPLSGGSWLRVMRPTNLLSGLLETLARVLIGVALLMVALSCLGGYLLADRALKPIDRVTLAAASLTERGAYRERVPISLGGDELTRLSLTINAMLDRLESTIEHEKSFAQLAAHELRTPLTVLAGRVELLLERPRDSAAYQVGLQQLAERIEALRALSEGLLRLASTGAPAVLERVELAGLVLEVADDLEHDYHAAGTTLHLDVEESWVLAEAEGVRQVAVNLLENALKYGGPHVTLRIGPGHLSVADDGPGPPQTDWPRLLRPLERGLNVHALSGSGLGLAVVATLAQRWQAQVRPRWSAQGFEVTLEFSQNL